MDWDTRLSWYRACLAFVKFPPPGGEGGLHPQHHINQIWPHSSVIPALRRRRQENRKFKDILQHLKSLSSGWGETKGKKWRRKNKG